MKKTTFFLLFLSSYLYSLAQENAVSEKDTTWTNSVKFGFNFNQASFSDNWTGGGINSIAFASLFNAQADYQQGKWSWDNELELIYGVIRNAGQDYRKSQDRIFLDSKLGYAIAENWNGFYSLNFLTQLAPGYRYVDNPTDPDGIDALTISRIFAPAFITNALGFEYTPNDWFLLRLSPFSPRITIVADTDLYLNTQGNTNYGVEIGEKVRYEWLAAQMQAEINKDLTETINLQSRYILFANYETLALETIDHRLDLTVTAKLTRYINVNLSAIMLYDVDQDPGIQLSQLLGVGVLLQK
ncbi:MAG: DUF3078 domain-containing protein [Cyclobacteriaceae bacterium]